MLLRPAFLRNFLKGYRSICPPAPQDPVVTLLDIYNPIGKNLALILKQNPHIRELRIFDENQDVFSIADDLNEIDTRTEVVAYPTYSLKEAIAGADLVVSFGGYQSKVGQSQHKLFEKNVDNIRHVAIHLAEFNPTAVYCIAKPPVEALVPAVSEEYKKAEKYDYRKIIGVTAHASMVVNHLIAEHLRTDPAEVLCPIIGGSGPKTTVPVISQTKPPVEYNSKIYTQLQDGTANFEEEILKEIDQDEEFPNLSRVIPISRFVNSVVKALKGDGNCVECAFVRQVGHIGEFLPYMTSIVKLGREGIESTHMPKINQLEVLRLRAAVPHILESILLGQTFVTGDTLTYKKFKSSKRKCDSAVKKKIEECKIRAGIQKCAEN